MGVYNWLGFVLLVVLVVIGVKVFNRGEKEVFRVDKRSCYCLLYFILCCLGFLLICIFIFLILECLVKYNCLCEIIYVFIIMF